MNEGEAQNDSTEHTDSDDNSTETDSERLQTTLRLPAELADQLDDWAERRGMSRNAAINYFIAEGLNPE